MHSKLRLKILRISVLLFAFAIAACGVRGDPVPPKKPSDLGRGQPTYRKATEKIPLQNYSPNEDEEKEEKDQTDE